MADKITESSIKDVKEEIIKEIDQVQSKFGITDKIWNAYLAGLRFGLYRLNCLEGRQK